MKTIQEAGDLRDKKVLLRVDWNVPLEKGKVSDDYRIRTTLPTIEYLQKSGAKVIIATHLGEKTARSTPKGVPALTPIFNHTKTLIPSLVFEEDGDVVLMDNLRKNPGEEANSEEFARELASMADIYVNGAFSASHRKHASIVGVPKFLPSFVGLRFFEEIQHLSSAFYPRHPFLFILGGSKFDTKIPVIDKFLNIADTIFVGGALAHNFFKDKGLGIGDSLVSSGDFGLKEKIATGKIRLPVDMLAEQKGKVHIVSPENVQEGDVIVDAGPNTLLELKGMVEKSSTILWNGPLGGYEDGYKQGTIELARIIAESGKTSILGGGDTRAAISELGAFDKFTFVSTGGGAMLDFLATGTLPGIEALEH